MRLCISSRWACLLSLCLLVRPAPAQDPVTARLPDSLMQDAGMVKRMDITEIDIESPRKARIHRKYLYTILNHNGDVFSRISTYYDKYHDLGSVNVVLYDAAGRVVKKIRKSDLQDWNIDGGGMLMMDYRVKTYQFGYHEYPYSISYEQETTLDGLFGLPPQWLPQPENDVSVVSCDLVIHAPADYPLQYRGYHLPDPEIVTEKKDTKTYTWRLMNRPVPDRQEYAPAWYEREPRVNLAPGSFEIEGYKGGCYSWTDLARFVGGLHQGRGQLPEEAKRKVHELVDGITGDREKIRVLYRFLQENTHYVGIELGIGGWQPFDAAYVYNKKYGDCKALSNYMVALLKEAGIRACPVLIRGGVDQPPVDTGFACIQFNHEIAVAFPGRDTVWLECTSSTLPAGYLGSFTADREGLLLDGNGGHIIHTPVYGIRDNHVFRTVKGDIDDRGNLEASLQTTYSGLDQDWVESMVSRLSKKDRIDFHRQTIGINNCLINDLSDSSITGPVPVMEETMHITAEQFAILTGNRLMISPGVFMKRLQRLRDETNRKTALELRRSEEEADTVIIRLPAGWTPEGNPLNANFTADFGNYRAQSNFQNGVLTLSCDYRQYQGIYPPGDYARLVRFFNLVYREAERQLVFIKN